MEVICGGQLHTTCGTAVTIGNFDGVHLGHQKLLSDLKTHARRQGLQSLVYTFSKHPLSVLDGSLPVITDNDTKTRLIEEAGADVLYFADFLAVKDLSPEAFVKEILLDRLHMKMAVIGENNRFGKNSQGDARLLCELGKAYGFPVCVVKPLIADGVVCSSSEIRKRILGGSMEGAARLLGRPFAVKEKVIDGKHLGRTYGFPTANMAPKDMQLLPKFGVYAANAAVDGVTYPAITHVGETSFDEKKIIRIESNLLGFHGNLYGKTLEITFLRYMRDSIPFRSTDALERQLKKDRENRIKDTEEGT